MALTTVTSYGKQAGSARVRVFDWLRELEVDAHSHTYLGLSANSPSRILRHPASVVKAERELRSLARRSSNETVFLSRQASPFSSGGIEAALLHGAGRGVYDFDDALADSPRRSSQLIWSQRRIWRRAVEAAEVVIAGNDYLADQASVYSKAVVVVPSCVSPEMYALKRSYEVSDRPTAVWLGSPSTEVYLQAIAGPLIRAHKEFGLQLKVISAGDQPLGPLDAMVDRITWTHDNFQIELAAADFGIMPLIDNEWSRGKCAYKLLQYGAAGLPMIGSPVGANRNVLEQGGGLSAQGNESWTQGIAALIEESSGERELRGRRGRELVEGQYSFTAWAPTWKRAVGILTDSFLA